MAIPIKTVAIATGNALVALDLAETIQDVIPWAKVVTLSAPVESTEQIRSLPDLLALIVDQGQAGAIDLHRVRHDGAAVIVIGEGDGSNDAGVAFLPLPFTTEMLTSLLRVVARPDPV